MKNLKNFSRCTLFLCLLIVIPFNQLPAQEKVNLSAGFGLPDLLNLGVRYQLEQTQLGLSVGSFPAEDKLLCISKLNPFFSARLIEALTLVPWNFWKVFSNKIDRGI